MDQPGSASTDAGGTARRVAVVYNPMKSDTAALRSAVMRGLDEVRAAAGQPSPELAEPSADWADPLWLETTPDDSGHGLARQALERGADLVFAAGGDGTVRAVAAGLRGSGVPLGVLPLGTGNLLARNLALPIADLAACVRIGLTGADHAIDLGVAELTRPGNSRSEHVFLVMAGIGMDAAMIANTDPRLKKHLGWLAYIDGGLRSLRSKKLQIEYQLAARPGEPDDVAPGERPTTHTAHVSTILAGNCGLLPGNIELMPDARIDDGELDVAILQPRTVFGWLFIWRKVTWENRVLRRSALGRQFIKLTGSDSTQIVTYLRGPAVEVDVGDDQPTQLDGDGFGRVTHARFWADARALVVRVP
jgi:diacylglycerol kinase (ATP)